MKLSGKRIENRQNSGKRRAPKEQNSQVKIQRHRVKVYFYVYLYPMPFMFVKEDSMIEPLFIVTNNPMSKSSFEDKYVVEYIEVGSQMDVLKKARNYVHMGNRLLTHPLMGSVKPNETPYKTICISKKVEKGVDLSSLEIIESAIATTEKFIRDFNTPKWSEKILLDFQVIDLDLIAHAIT